MTKVPTIKEITEATDGISRPTLSNGSAHALPMTTEQLEKAAKPKIPFGFNKPSERKSGKG